MLALVLRLVSLLLITDTETFPSMFPNSLMIIERLLQIQDEGRSKVRQSLTPTTAQSALQRILPFPCKKQYTVVILMPRTSPFKSLKSFFQSTETSYQRHTKVSSSQNSSFLN